MRAGYILAWYRVVSICIFTLLLSGTVSADETVRHTLSFPTDRQQTILVRSEFPVSAPVTELIMPNWTPGSYRIREYAANVDRISAVSDDGKRLAVRKSSKDRWQVNTEKVTTLIVDYDVFTPEIKVSSSWAGRAFVLVNGASVFLYTPLTRDLSQQLDIVTSAARGEIFTALPESPDGAGYRAADYDELVDNPVVVANAPSYRFKSKKQEYVLVNIGENEFWDGEQAAADVEKIVKETQSFWRSNPLSRPFWFLNFAVEGKGGLEHDHSTVIMTGRRQMRDRDDYVKWLGVVAHEFFHVWNVRHMRPAELAKYNYQREQYTRQLWLAEGLTSYYDNLLLSRAGLISPEEYMEQLATDIQRLETTPGRKLRSVTEASVDTWVRHYRPNANSINSTISYYTKGAVIGFVLDAYLRKASKGRHDLDEVMREMYKLYAGTPYTSEDFRKVVADVGGPEAVRFLEPLLDTTIDPDVDAALDWFGLKLERDPNARQAEIDGDPVKSGFGVIWDEDKADLIVKSVLAGSSGAAAGILPRDEVLAIGDERLTKDKLQSLMTAWQPGRKTTLLVARRGQIITLEVELEAAIPERFDIVLKSVFGKRQISRLQSLLGQNLQEKP
jgi:predicted metalloprotease with PDZ domain